MMAESESDTSVLSRGEEETKTNKHKTIDNARDTITTRNANEDIVRAHD